MLACIPVTADPNAPGGRASTIDPPERFCLESLRQKIEPKLLQPLTQQGANRARAGC
jgi:hypothetical protein